MKRNLPATEKFSFPRGSVTGKFHCVFLSDLLRYISNNEFHTNTLYALVFVVHPDPSYVEIPYRPLSDYSNSHT